MEFITSPLASKPSIAPQIKERPQYIFWFRPEDGQVFCCHEEEAWNIMRGRIKIMIDGSMVRKKFEYLGASDSLTYFRGMKEVNKIFTEQGLEKAQEHLRSLHEQELAQANRSIRPRNMDNMDLDGKPVQNIDIFNGLMR